MKTHQEISYIKLLASQLHKYQWIVLSISTSAIAIILVNYQSSQIIALYDFSYYTDIATRIISGQTPYKDFPLMGTPGSYYHLAIILSISPGSVDAIYYFMYMQIIICNLMIFKLANDVSYKYKSLQNLKWVLALSAGILNLYIVFHQPYYDADAYFYIVLSIFMFIKIFDKNVNVIKLKIYCSIAGFCTLIPFIMKQNIGIPWAAIINLYMLSEFILKYKKSQETLREKYFLIGSSSTAFLIIMFLVFSNNFRNFLYFTVTLPLKIRNSSFFSLIQGLQSHEKPILIILAVTVIAYYFQKVQILKYRIHLLLFVLLSSVYLLSNFEIFQLKLSTSREQLIHIYPFLLFLVIAFTVMLIFSLSVPRYIKAVGISSVITLVFTLLPQGFYGSSNSIWPVVFLVLILLLSKIEIINHKSELALAPSIMIVTILILYTNLNMVKEQTRYDWLRSAEPVSQNSGQFSQLGTPGNYLLDSEIASDVFERYKDLGKTAIFPGEEPVAFLTSKLPDTDVSSSDPSTNPNYSNVLSWLNSYGIEYLIFRAEGQNKNSTEANLAILNSLKEEYKLIEVVSDYEIYKSVSN
jgi:hypothetical protein